jgi:hypothetical protein
MGHAASHQLVAEMLSSAGYSLQSNRKGREGPNTTAIAWPFGKKTPTRGGAARLGWRSGRSPPGGNILLRWPQGENWKRAAQCERLVPVRRPIL